MSSRLDDIPVYQQSPVTVTAADYNRVQIALKRLDAPVRIPLIGLRTLELLLERDAWIVIDRALNEIPVLAWTDFQVADRDSLHEPVPCVLKMYHAHAMTILDKVISCMEGVLQQRIDKLYEKDLGDKVVPMSKRK